MLKFTNYTELQEGGAFGHLENVYDVNFTFRELSHFINDSLAGNLHYVEEKTDAVNLMVSYRKDKGMIASRNKSHLKNFGENALNAASIRIKFKNRVLEHAYGKAMDDLASAVKSLSPKQAEKVFANGAKWLSIEVMGHGAENIIEYGVRELRLHGTIEHNKAGEQIAPIDKEAARMFDGMLRQRGTHQQGSFTIKNLNKVHLPKVSEFTVLKTKYNGMLNAIKKEYNLKPSSTIQDMKNKAWTDRISKYTKDDELTTMLVNRWASYVKQPTIAKIKKDNKEHVDWITELEADSKSFNKQIMLPLERTFLGLGADRLETMAEFMAINPDHTVKALADKIETAMKAIRKSGNPDLINKLEIELTRLANKGKLIPTEGITFFWKGHFLKLTGNFAAANQIVGMMYRL